MTKANFYLLKQSSEDARRQFACRLAEQQAKQGRRVFIKVASSEEAQELDQLLWSFSAESFVPHAMAGTPDAEKMVNVVIGCDKAPRDSYCLLNLTGAAVNDEPELAAIAEFVLNEETAKAQSRALWNAYRQLGYELQHHQL